MTARSSRRTLLGGAAMLPALGATAHPARPAVAAGADAGLVAACARWHVVQAEHERLSALLDVAENEAEVERLGRLVQDLAPAFRSLEDAIAAARARTPAEFRTKAEVVAVYPEPSPISASLLEDLLRGVPL